MAEMQDELKARIDADVRHLGGVLPERNAIAWRGYLAALLEWNLISVALHDDLLRLLPPIDDDPVVDILRGRE
jgi:hypothetical protein